MEEQKEHEEQEEQEISEKSAYPTQTLLAIRAIVGGYVIYLAYQLVTSGDKMSIPIWAAVVVFIIAGAALIVLSVKHFICGEYEGGKKDV